ncbi:hypothetical protein A3G16_01510 [Candidatus Curtissbacteria bacterium RIFCSPLOWO2_12_FULL_41_16]|nr:MAG: hypothetical protein A3G16_01510 [Candidatus Curtissbacteria bacterium RIFCSPLOWO2_12_FULL_41_16]
MDFATLLRFFLESFDPYSKDYFSVKVKTVSKYPKLIGRFYKDLFDFTSGGKKLRAFLVYLGYLIGSSNFKESPLTSKKTPLHRILPISLALEIIHSFLLIHDDIIDRSEIRRGKLAIHKKYEKLLGVHYGESMAIVLGDLACSEAFRLVSSSSFEDTLKIKCLQKLLEILTETVYGQALDVFYSYRKATLSGIWQVADLKTARYSFVGPLVIGAMFAEAKNEQVDVLTGYGLYVGTAFQIHDDILGIFGDEKVLGKSVLSDLREGKNTILIYKTKELSGGKDKTDLERIWGKREATEKDLRRVRAIIRDSGGLEWCQNESLRLVGEAKKQVGKIVIDVKMRDIFCQTADFVIRRDK